MSVSTKTFFKSLVFYKNNALLKEQTRLIFI